MTDFLLYWWHHRSDHCLHTFVYHYVTEWNPEMLIRQKSLPSRRKPARPQTIWIKKPHVRPLRTELTSPEASNHSWKCLKRQYSSFWALIIIIWLWILICQHKLMSHRYPGSLKKKTERAPKRNRLKATRLPAQRHSNLSAAEWLRDFKQWADSLQGYSVDMCDWNNPTQRFLERDFADITVCVCVCNLISGEPQKSPWAANDTFAPSS